ARSGGARPRAVQERQGPSRPRARAHRTHALSPHQEIRRRLASPGHLGVKSVKLRTDCSSVAECNFPISKPALPLALNLLFTFVVSSRESTAAARWILVADGDEAAANGVAGAPLPGRFRAHPPPRRLHARPLG